MADSRQVWALVGIDTVLYPWKVSHTINNLLHVLGYESSLHSLPVQ